MRRHLKKLLLLPLLLILAYGAVLGYYDLNNGFCVWKISSNHPYRSEWNVAPLADAQKEEVLAALSQEYLYLAKGMQSYCFESRDGKYVIKFMKQHRYKTIWSRFTWLPFPPSLAAYANRKSKEAVRDREYTFNSYRLAYDALAEENGLVFMQLNPQPIVGHRVVLIDKLGVKHSVNIDNMVYALQRKADLVGDRVDRLMSQGDEEAMKRAIRSMLGLFQSYNRKGIKDEELGKFCVNYGFVGDKAIAVDIGQYVIEPSLEDPTRAYEEILRKAGPMKKWLQSGHPSMAAYLEELLQSQEELYKALAMEETAQGG